MLDIVSAYNIVTANCKACFEYNQKAEYTSDLEEKQMLFSLRDSSRNTALQQLMAIGSECDSEYESKLDIVESELEMVETDSHRSNLIFDLPELREEIAEANQYGDLCNKCDYSYPLMFMKMNPSDYMRIFERESNGRFLCVWDWEMDKGAGFVQREFEIDDVPYRLFRKIHEAGLLLYVAGRVEVIDFSEASYDEVVRIKPTVKLKRRKE